LLVVAAPDRRLLVYGLQTAQTRRRFLLPQLAAVVAEYFEPTQTTTTRVLLAGQVVAPAVAL
jgi:hypothetical protein